MDDSAANRRLRTLFVVFVICVCRGVKWCHSPEPEEIANECRVNQNEGDIQ